MELFKLCGCFQSNVYIFFVGKVSCLNENIVAKNPKRRTHAFIFRSVPLGKNISKNVGFNGKICVGFFLLGNYMTLKKHFILNVASFH